MNLHGQVAVLTGAASGIGRATALALAQRGCHLALADIDTAGLAETAAAAAAHGVTVSQHALDVASRDAVAALPAAVLAVHGRVSLLINNAGVAVGGTFDQVAEADFDWLMDINFHGLVRMTRAFLPVLRQQPVARIVNISSVFGLTMNAVRGFSNARCPCPPARRHPRPRSRDGRHPPADPRQPGSWPTKNTPPATWWPSAAALGLRGAPRPGRHRRGGHAARGQVSTRRIGLRADMDALPIAETSGKPWASKVFGKMHACGHDGHTAMLLSAARHLAATRNFDGILHVVFQPAEEGLAGARKMLEDGFLELFPCDAMFGMHNMPGLPEGQFVAVPGFAMASGDTCIITVAARAATAPCRRRRSTRWWWAPAS
jgi:NAD(P)-dependent dehydrogenase (short-subunit alcohol dehydrogenase family)